MKNTVIIGLLIVSTSVFGQIPGKPIFGPVVLFDTVTINAGDIITLGKGSNPETGNFVHLFAPKNKIAPIAIEIIVEEFTENDLEFKSIPRMDLPKGFEGKQLVIESLNKVSSKKAGERILGIINMKEYQFIEGVFFNDVVVDFGPAIRSGEILKISSPTLAEDTQEADPLFSPFEMTRKGIEPVVVAFTTVSRNELYSKAMKWTNASYVIPIPATITTADDHTITIKAIEKNVQLITIMGTDLYGDLPYEFTVNFSDNQIQMNFTLGGKNGDITAEDGEVIASIAPSRMFEKNGEVRKMGQVLKVEAERLMNTLSNDLVTYLMK